MFLAITFVGITLGALVAWQGIINQFNFPSLVTYVMNVGFNGPYYFPLVFAAYALGKKRLTMWIVVCFGICQLASVVWLYLRYVPLDKKGL